MRLKESSGNSGQLEPYAQPAVTFHLPSNQIKQNPSGERFCGLIVNPSQ